MREAPTFMRVGRDCPEDAVFLRARNANDQDVEVLVDLERPLYVWKSRAGGWVRVELKEVPGR